MFIKIFIEVLGSFLIGVSIGVYIAQLVSLVCNIIDNEDVSKREILWKVTPFGFVLLIMWKWKEINDKGGK